MKFQPLEVAGAFVIFPEPHADSRGAFARLFCEKEFAAAGLPTQFTQASYSNNSRAGTLRGLHLQTQPHTEGKLIRVTSGVLFDVAIDLRPESPTYLKKTTIVLSAHDHQQLFLPEGTLHGFQTLEDNTEVTYHMTQSYHPDSARTIRWNDPAFAIPWPIIPPILSEKDALAPFFKSAD